MPQSKNKSKKSSPKTSMEKQGDNWSRDPVTHRMLHRPKPKSDESKD